MPAGIRTPLNPGIKSPSIYDRPRPATSGPSPGSCSPMAGNYRLKEVMASAPTCTKNDLAGIAVRDYPGVQNFYQIRPALRRLAPPYESAAVAAGGCSRITLFSEHAKHAIPVARIQSVAGACQQGFSEPGSDDPEPT